MLMIGDMGEPKGGYLNYFGHQLTLFMSTDTVVGYKEMQKNGESTNSVTLEGQAVKRYRYTLICHDGAGVRKREKVRSKF